MAKNSNSWLKLVPDKLMNLLTEQDEDYFSSQETDDFLFQEREIMDSKRKGIRFASCDIVSLFLFLALIAIFVSQSSCIKVYGCDFDNWVSTKIYSPDHSTNCHPTFWVSNEKKQKR